MAENTRETQLRGLATEWRTMTYNWRDCALYALAVGAKGDEPQYTYENGMQAIPTFGATPYWGTVNVTSPAPAPSRCWWRSCSGRSARMSTWTMSSSTTAPSRRAKAPLSTGMC